MASRRKADRLILSGDIKVNGRTVKELGVRVNPAKDDIIVKGEKITAGKSNTYIMLHKPKGYIVTMDDPFNRALVLDLLPALETRVFPVGRLDADSEGLLLLTDDGELSYRLTHPRFRVSKVYMVKVKGFPPPDSISRLERGIVIDGKKTAPAALKLVAEKGNRALFRMSIREGKKREIRKMFSAVGHEVIELKRVQIGPLKLGGLKKGQWRFLKPSEINRLKKWVSLAD